MTRPTTPLEYVQAFRAQGLTQLQIEERTGIPQSTISKIERGQIHDVLSARYLALQRLYAEMFPEEACCHGKTKAAR
jgi:transcriptional regulator with XRE-family HTH domain